MNLFPYFKEVALDSGHADNVDLNTEAIHVLLLNGYTYDATDKYVSDVLAGPETEIARGGPLTAPTVLNGTFDAADFTFAAGEVAAGETVTDIVIFCNVGGADTARVVIAHIDEDQAASPLSFPGNGSAVDIQFHASGIFDL